MTLPTTPADGEKARTEDGMPVVWNEGLKQWDRDLTALPVITNLDSAAPGESYVLTADGDGSFKLDVALLNVEKEQFFIEGTGQTGAGSFDFLQFSPPKTALWFWEILQYNLYTDGFTGRVSRGLELNDAANSGGNQIMYEYLIKTTVTSNSYVDVAVVGDGAPYKGLVPVHLDVDTTYHLRSVSNTGSFRTNRKAIIKFTEL